MSTENLDDPDSRSLSFKDELKRGAKLLGLNISNNQLNSFDVYRTELQKWGKVYNLTSNLSDSDILTLHFLDSLLYLKGFPKHKNLAVADIGTGAGFPGIPLSIMQSDMTVTLFEPTGKKVIFLNNIVRRLNLKNVQVLQMRAEDYKDEHDYSDVFDVIVSRALFDLTDLIRATSTMMQPGGRWILSKGRKYLHEFKKELGNIEIKRVSIPIENVDRWLIILIT